MALKAAYLARVASLLSLRYNMLAPAFFLILETVLI